MHTDNKLGDMRQYKVPISSNITRGLILLAAGVRDLLEVKLDLGPETEKTINLLKSPTTLKQKCLSECRHLQIWDSIENEQGNTCFFFFFFFLNY